MPENKNGPLASTAAGRGFQNGRLPAPPPAPAGGSSHEHNHQPLEMAASEMAASGASGSSTATRRGSGWRAKGGRGGGGFPRSQGAKAREYDSAKRNGVGSGGAITSSSDRAVSECVDLKLTLKQRLDK